jgi:hypothetical protein
MVHAVGQIVTGAIKMKKKGLAVFFERRERTMLQFPAYIRSMRFRRGLGDGRIVPRHGTNVRFTV